MKKIIHKLLIIFFAILLGVFAIKNEELELSILNVRIWSTLSISFVCTSIIYLCFPFPIPNENNINEKLKFFFLLGFIAIILECISFFIIFFVNL